MPDRGAGPTDSAVQALRRQRDLGKLLSMMGLSFLVLLVVGILRPVRSAIALAGLEPGDFYQVYFVSAIVVLVAPLYNRLADRISWQRLIPAVAVFFAASLVVFRLLYQPGVSWFGLVFYGWYDLLVASLITQFFMATQMFYNARDAKRAYPLVIAAGSTGAALGGATSYLLADKIGAENMLPIAAAIIVVFAVGIALVWAREIAETGPARRQKDADLSTGEFKRIFSHPQVRLIAVTVLLTVLVKQFVDYEYNTLIREVFTDVDEIAGFLGLVDALTQWLPILVLLSLRPILRRWGAGLTVIIFPVAVIFATGALALSIWLSAAALAMAVAARTTEKMFRYSAERTGREILYVPIPDDIKLKAKAYIDVGVEKGVGKVLSGLLLAIPALALASLPVANRLIVVAFAGLALAVGLLLVFLRVRRQYVTSLAESFEGRFASLRGTFVSMADTGALELAREALTDGQPFKVAFALDLLKEADHEDVAALAPELHDLLDHENKQIRAGGLAALIRLPSGLDEERVRRSLEDESAQVRLAAVRLLAVGIGRPPHEVIEELLESREPAVRAAALACLATDFGGDEAERIVEPRFEKLLTDDAAKTQEAGWALELARAAALVAHHPQVEDVLRRLLGHPDPEVASAAVLSATRLPQDAMVGEAIAALAAPGTRAAARAGLAERGEPVLGPLITALNDPGSDPWVRRGVASTLGEIPTSATVNALITSYLLRETEQALDDQALVSLHRLRSGNDDLSFPKERILEAVDREVDAAERYRRAAGSVARLDATPAQALLARGLREVRDDRRASVFRWLGLVYPEAGMRRSYLALGGQDDRQRAKALEWIESTVGHGIFERLSPVLGDEVAPDESDRADAGWDLWELWSDEDVWIARCALWTSFESEPDRVRGRLSGFAPTDPGLERVVSRLERLTEGGAPGDRGSDEGDSMDLIEKVFLLQNVDLLSGVSSRQLALLASIAGDIETREGAVLLRKGEPTDALYVVIHGEVSLEGIGDSAMSITDGQAFGTWAFIDDQPSLVKACAVKSTRVLRILREDFRDLLVDHPELGLNLLQGLARRVRSLAGA